jgi:aryl-alcohol dehydrogenase-like predicted oxidoreductase
MSLRPLGSSGLRVSPLGFGCWQLGGDGWGRSSAPEARRAIARGLDLGINLFDTAPIYGFGRSEELLGQALRQDRGDAVVVSKVGLVWDDRRRVAHDNRPGSLVAQVEASLRRLRREALDVCLLHWPDPAVPLAASAAVLEDLRGAGKVRAWGVSNFPAALVLALERTGLVLEYPLNALGAYAGEHQAAAQAALELLPRTLERGWGFLAYDVLARGLLGGRYTTATRFGKRDVRHRDQRFATAARPAHLERVAELATAARREGSTVAAASIRAVLERAGVSSCIVGMRSAAQVEENAGALRGPQRYSPQER